MPKPVMQEPALTKSVNLAELFPVIQEVLDKGGTFSLTITGTSMWPTIYGGRDQVTLTKAPEKLKKYDLPLYRRKTGQFVLHRIVACNPDGSYDCCGDHQWEIERGLKPEQMVGLVVSLVRKGKRFSASSFRYRAWVRFWCWILPLRPFAFKTYRLFRKALRKLRLKR